MQEQARPGVTEQHPPEPDSPRSTPVPGADPAVATPPTSPEVVVRARGLRMDGHRGPVFLPVDLDATAGALLVLAGPAGSGRTSLLLTLAGRMAPSGGTLAVAGQQLPEHRGAVQRAVTLATMCGVNELDGSLTVEEHVLERLALTSPWWRLLTPSTSDVPGVLALVDDRYPRLDGHPRLDRDTVVRDLAPYDRFRLGVALALAGRSRERPRILIADDVDDLRDPRAVEAAWLLLHALAGSDTERVPGGLTVIASCSAAGTIPDEVRIDDRTMVRRIHRPGTAPIGTTPVGTAPGTAAAGTTPADTTPATITAPVTAVGSVQESDR